MESFIGHAGSGLFSVCVSIWWAINKFDRYFRSQIKSGLPYRNAVCYPCGCAPNVSIESILKILLFSCFLIPGIIYTCQGSNPYTNVQHCTMYGFIILGGIMDILVLNKHRFRFLPPDLDYVCLILMPSVSALLLFFHLHGPMMEVRVHLLLVVTSIGAALSCVAEMKYRTSFLAGLTRSYFFLVAGTWLCHIGFILFPPAPWMLQLDLNSHDQVMLVTAMYTWHYAGALVVLLLIGAIQFRKYRHLEMFTEKHDYHAVPSTYNLANSLYDE